MGTKRRTGGGREAVPRVPGSEGHPRGATGRGLRGPGGDPHRPGRSPQTGGGPLALPPPPGAPGTYQRLTARRGELRCSSAASGGRRGPERGGAGGAGAASSSCPAAIAAAAAPQERRAPAPLPSPGSSPTPPGTGIDTGATREGTASPVPGPRCRLGPVRCAAPPPVPLPPAGLAVTGGLPTVPREEAVGFGHCSIRCPLIGWRGGGSAMVGCEAERGRGP